MASKKTAGTTASKPVATKASTSKPAAPKTAAPKTAAPKTAAPKTAAPKTAAPKTAAPKTAAPKTAAPRTAAPKTAAPKTAAPKTAAPKTAAPKTAAPKTAAPKPAAPKTAAVRKAAAKKAAAKPAAKAKKPAKGPAGTDPEGFFVARVRGEEGVRAAPRSLLEQAEPDDEPGAPALYDEELGELPWSYGDDTLMALPRDPRTLFVYWDHGAASLEAGFRGLDHPRVQIWVFAEQDGWQHVRTLECALESRGYYVHDLEPGRRYRAEIHVVDRRGQERLLGHSSNATGLPPLGASGLVDDRFVLIPWDLPLGALLGPGTPGGPFSEGLRALLARLSDWSRLQGGAGGGGTGGTGGRPTSLGGPPVGGGPSSPSSPFGPFGGERR